MSFFLRMQKAGNPFHAANGEFASANESGAGKMQSVDVAQAHASQHAYSLGYHAGLKNDKHFQILQEASKKAISTSKTKEVYVKAVQQHIIGQQKAAIITMKTSNALQALDHAAVYDKVLAHGGVEGVHSPEPTIQTSQDGGKATQDQIEYAGNLAWAHADNIGSMHSPETYEQAAQHALALSSNAQGFKDAMNTHLLMSGVSPSSAGKFVSDVGDKIWSEAKSFGSPSGSSPAPNPAPSKAVPDAMEPKAQASKMAQVLAVQEAGKLGATPFNDDQLSKIGELAGIAHAQSSTPQEASEVMSSLIAPYASSSLGYKQGIAVNGVNWEDAFTKGGVKTPAVTTAPAPKAKYYGANVTDKATDIQGTVSTDGFRSYDGQHDELASDMNQRKLSGQEQTSLGNYKGNGYDQLNSELRSGRVLSSDIAEHVVALTTATTSGTIPGGTVIFRGVSSVENAFGSMSALKDAVYEGKAHIDNGFISCSTSKSFSDTWGGSSGVLMELKLKRDTPAVHVAKGRGNKHDSEYEVVLPRGMLWKVQGMRRDKTEAYGGKLIVTMEQM